MIFPTQESTAIFRSIKMTDEIILQLTTTASALCCISSNRSNSNNYNHRKINHVAAYAVLDDFRKEKNC